MSSDSPAGPGLGEIARLFSRLGLTAFGGPAAHIAMMENEVVSRRRWLTPERFLDMMGATNLIPGPSSSELAIFIGYELAGVAGLLVAGACFILPAALLTTAIAWAYVRFGALPQVGGILYGIKPVVIAIVIQALWGLAPKALKKSNGLTVLALLAGGAAAFGVDAIVVLLGANATALIAHTTKSRTDVKPLFLFAPAAIARGDATPASLGMVFLTFLKLGAIVFGSGYVLLAFLRADLVERHHWMTEPQLIDAVAVGQLTPGPVFTTATFIGYVIAGGWGATLATVAIFLPGFLLVAAIRPLVARVRRTPAAGAFLDGVNVASVALMGVVTVQLGKAALVDGVTIALAGLGAILLLRFKVSSMWLIALGAIVGVVAHGLRG